MKIISSLIVSEHVFFKNCIIDFSSESRFQKFVHLFTVICELFQELIMASKVDWSGDEKLQDLVIMLGKPVTF